MNFVLLDSVKFKSRKNRILLHKIMFVNVMHLDLSCWPTDQSKMVFHQYELKLSAQRLYGRCPIVLNTIFRVS